MEKGNESTMWSSLSAWCTPIVLFGFANLIIATLFLASKTNTQTTAKHHDENNVDHDYGYIHGVSFTPVVARVSSIFERAKSVNLSSIIPNIITAVNNKDSKPAKYTSLSRLSQSIFSICDYDSQPDSPRYPSNKPKPVNPPTSLLGRLKSISNIYGDDKTSESEDDHSIKSDSRSHQPVVRVPSFFDRIKSFRLVVPLKKTRSEVRKSLEDKDERVRLQRPETARAKRNADDDAKAENFITKFREQLKLQRRDSFDRYNDMLRN